MDVFFDFLEAYPPDVAFGKLDELIQRLSSTSRIASIQLVGSQDGNEKDLASLHLARKRAEFVKRYFQAVGVGADVPLELSAREAGHPVTPVGRARDRVTEIKVVAHRRRAVAP